MEDKSLYRPLVSRAWQITKRYKSLWFLAFFAAFWSSGELEIIIRALYYPQSNGIIFNFFSGLKWGTINGLTLAGGNFLVNTWQAIAGNPLAFLMSLVIFILSLAIGLFIVWLATVAQIGLISNIFSHSRNKLATANEGISQGVKNFWPVFIVNAVFRLCLLGFFALLGGVLLSFSGHGLIGSLFYALLFLILAAVILTASFLVRYQLFFIILKKQTIIDALKSAWKLFRKNWVISAEMALIMFGFYLVVYFVTVYIAAVFTAVLTVAILIYFPALPLIIKLLMGIITIIFIIAALVVGTCLIITFQWTGWVMLFDRLTSGIESSKIYRLAQQAKNLPSYFKKS